MISQIRRRKAQSFVVGPIVVLAVCIASTGWANEIALEGFLPLVGIGLTDEFQTLDEDLLFSVADPSPNPTGAQF